jgi:hypothetical protein
VDGQKEEGKCSVFEIGICLVWKGPWISYIFSSRGVPPKIPDHPTLYPERKKG